MKRKLWVVVLSVLMAFSCAIFFSACAETPEQNEEQEWTLEAVYARAQELGYDGSLEEFLAQIQGKDGIDGKDGVGISDVALNDNGELILILTDGNELNCGKIVGEKGEDGADGVSIVGANIDGDGILSLTLSDGTTIQCGKVTGDTGNGIQEITVNEQGDLCIVYTDGTTANLGKIIGEDGQDGQDGADGKDGVGVKTVVINEAGELVITLTNETELNLGTVIGKNGQDGADGKDGDSVSGASINGSGELVLTFVSGKTVTVGNVVGQDGQDGQDGADGVGVKTVVINEAGELVITLTNETELNLGTIIGKDGQDGKDGDSVSGASINENGELVLTFVSGKTVTVGNVVGQDGQDGVGVKNVVINEAGELVITLTNETELNLGTIIGKDGQDGKDGDSVSGASINESGELILTFVSGKTVTVGNVVGQDGQDGQDGADGVGVKTVVINEAGELVITLTNETELNLGTVIGKDGQDGKDGASVTKAEINAENHLILTFTDGHTLDCGNVKGEDGVGISNIYFNDKGELIIALTDGSEVNCGKIPVCTHSYSDWTPQKEATCTSIGYKIRTCSICGHIEYEFLDELGHDIQIYFTTQSMHSGVCERCGEYVQQVHKFNEDNICAICGYTADYSVGLKYILNEDKVSWSVAGIGTFSGTELVIPETYQNLPVINISASAFSGHSMLTSITIPESIVTIEKYAFNGCTAAIIWGGNPQIKSIGLYAFSGYEGNTITLPQSVINIDGVAFYGCYMTSITLPDSVTSIGSQAFERCGSLTSITIPDSVISIGSSAFNSCVSLRSLTIGEGVTDIGTSAFKNCSALEVINFNAVSAKVKGNSDVFAGAGSLSDGIIVTFGESVQQIPASLFTYSNDQVGCPNITSVIVGNNVKSIGYCAFYKNKSLTSITMGNNVETIANSAFSNCIALESIIIPDSVTSFEGDTFHGCTSLKSVTIGKGVTNMGGGEFQGCTSLIEIKYNAVSMDDFTVSSNSVFANSGNITNGLTVVFGDSVQRIPAYLFSPGSYNTNLTKAILGNGIKSIGNHAFDECYGLTSITIPDSVINIEDFAFIDCFKLVEIYNKSSLTLTIGSTDHGHIAYYAKNIYTEEKGSWFTDTVDGYRFFYDGSKGYLLGYNGTETVLSLPASFKAYNGTEITEYEIYQTAFKGCSEFANISIPDSVKSIGDYAFQGCSSLTSITIPSSVSYIGSFTFARCDLLVIYCEAASMPSEWNSNWNYYSCPVIWDCKNNEIADDGYIYTSIDGIRYSLKDNTATIIKQVSNTIEDEIIIPASITYNDNIYTVTSIIENAFRNCNLIESVTIPNGMISIGENAFYDCTSLTSITIPESVKSISNEVFHNCTSLSSIIYKGTIDEWNGIIKGNNWNFNTGEYTIYCIDGAIAKEE